MTDDELERRLFEYIKNNKHYYNIYEQNYLDQLDLGYIKKYNKLLPNVIRQVLEEIGYYDNKSDESLYNYFINIIESKFGLDKRLVEVGGGVVPTLSHKISLKQNSGSITVYDPLLSNYYNENDSFILKKERFSKSTSLKDVDLIFGFMPCEVTQDIIECALDNNTDFLIALCDGGPHGDEFDFYESIEEWTSGMIYIARRGVENNKMGNLKVLTLDRYYYDYPIIYNERSK